MYADPAQYRYLAWAGWDVDDLDHDMSDAWKPRIDIFFCSSVSYRNRIIVR